MSNTPITVDAFPGLNLEEDAAELGFRGALDNLNLDYLSPGLPKRRPGTDRFTTHVADASAQSRYGTVHYNPDHDAVYSVFYDDGTTDLRIVRLSDGGTVEQAFSHGGSSGSSVQAARMVNFGTDSASYVFVALGGAGGDDTVVIHDGATPTASGYTGDEPDGQYLAVTPWDNRLVSAGGTSTNSNDHRVRFSAEGDPLTWGTTAGSDDDFYVELTPGDGERIMEVVVWGDLMFVFKQTRFFVFYGVDVLPNGTPVFNYRTVEGFGIPSRWRTRAPAAAAARDGVYFVNYEGVWRTTGGPPQKVSKAIDPWFTQESSPPAATPFHTDLPSAGDLSELSCLTARGDMIYLYGYTDWCLVYHTTEGWWSRWELPGLTYQSFLYALDDRPAFADSAYKFLQGNPPELLYSTTNAGTNEYYRMHIMGVSSTADADYEGNYSWGVYITNDGGTLSGTFTITFDDGTTSDTTAAIDYDATAAEVQSALVLLDNLTADDISVTGEDLPAGTSTLLTIEFTTYGAYGGADGAAASFSVGTDSVANGTVNIDGLADGGSPNPIQCYWQSGYTDLGTDEAKVIKELLVTGGPGVIAVGLDVDMWADVTTEAMIAAFGTSRIRRGHASRRGRLIALRVENDTDSIADSEVNWRRVTLNLLGKRAGPQREAGT